jgi:hypothetical protein
MPALGYPQAPVAEAIGTLYDQAPGLVYQPPQLCVTTAAAFAAVSNGGEPSTVVPMMLGLGTNYSSGAQAGGMPPLFADAPGTQFTARTRETRNQAAWQRYCREHALCEVGYAIPGVAIESYAEAAAMEARIMEAFDLAETAAADAGFDAVFVGLMRLRSAVLMQIDARKQTRVPLVQYQTLTTSNALVLAWKFYCNAERDLELVEAVRAINPAFMPRAGHVKAT